MQPRAALLIFFLLTFSDSQGQQAIIDSLKNVLPQTARDSVRVIVLCELAARHLAYQPPVAKQYADDALALARELKFARGEVQALLHLGDYNFRVSNYALGIDYAAQSLKIAEKDNNELAMADAFRLLGNISNLGLRQYDQSLQYQLKALAIYERNNDERRTAALYGSITWIYAMLNQELAKAHQLADKGVMLAIRLKDYQLISYNYNSKALLFLKEEKLDSAMVNINRSIDWAEKASDLGVIAYNGTIKGDILLKQERWVDAKNTFSESLALSSKLKMKSLMSLAYAGLASSYENLNDYKAAYRNRLRFAHLRDSVASWETAQKTLLLQMGYETAKNEAKILELEREKERAETQNTIYLTLSIIGLVTFSTIIGLIVRNGKQRRKASLILTEKSKEIERQNGELISSREEVALQRDVVARQNVSLQQLNDTKDRLFSIIGHDLRGPIANLRSLLTLVSSNAVSQDEFMQLAPKLGQNVSHIHDTLENLLQWSLSQMKGTNQIPTQFSIKELAERMISLYSELAKSKNIELSEEVPKELNAFADNNQIQLVLRNLVHNAIKFTPEFGKVVIRATKSGDFVKVSIVDSGIGISSDRLATLFTGQHSTTSGTLGEKGTGLGLLLCKEMTEANGGRLEAESVVNKGSSFSIYLPQRAIE